MFESEDCCLGYYLTIAKTLIVLDHFWWKSFFISASEQASRPFIRQTEISYLFS